MSCNAYISCCIHAVECHSLSPTVHSERTCWWDDICFWSKANKTRTMFFVYFWGLQSLKSYPFCIGVDGSFRNPKQPLGCTNLANHGINYQLVIAGFLNHEKYHEITGDPLKTRSNAAPYGDTICEYLSLHMYMYMYNVIRLDPTYLCIIIYEICIFALES